MDIFVILFLNSIKVVFMQTCHEFQVQEVIHANKYAVKHHLSCLMDLSLEQCALECLLVTKCKSINHVTNIKANAGRPLCEMHTDEGGSPFKLKDENGSHYVDIREWPQEVAKTCAQRPCADNQRCIPTSPYRCMDIDCGIPQVVPYFHTNTNMDATWTSTTVGSAVKYVCRNEKRRPVYVSGHGVHRCYQPTDRLCNSDSTWTTQYIYCLDKPE